MFVLVQVEIEVLSSRRQETDNFKFWRKRVKSFFFLLLSVSVHLFTSSSDP